mgnify:FL=1
MGPLQALKKTKLNSSESKLENIFFDKKDLLNCGKNVIIGKTVRIRSPEKVSIGDNSIIDDFTYISGSIEIGGHVHIGAGCTLSGSKKKISIGDFTSLSSGVKIYAASSNFMEASLDSPTIEEEFLWNGIYEDVILNPFSLLGANSVILPGCILPEGLSVAASLVVRKKLKLEKWHVLLNEEGKMRPRKKTKELKDKIFKFYKKEY